MTLSLSLSTYYGLSLPLQHAHTLPLANASSQTSNATAGRANVTG
ncbi:hypothetical protein BFJ68_g1047 [Fusarium oxysporum]|uniref:Uncharacterized protein n=1 Tax=Fusarium oxysporum TaxID=5507 RepID=A0A420S3S9_FUSOX|nr:hypothetical protein BFJ68_g1047 [Fusarium oxysporum]